MIIVNLFFFLFIYLGRVPNSTPGDLKLERVGSLDWGRDGNGNGNGNIEEVLGERGEGQGCVD